MHQLTITIPKRGPLRTGDHLIVGKDRTQIMDGVLENSGRGEIVKVFTVLCKLQLTKNRIGIWRHFALEQGFDGKRDKRRQRDGGRICDSGGVGDGWR